MNLEDLKERLGDDFPKLVAFVQGKDDAIAASSEKDVRNRAKFKEVADDRDNLRRKYEAIADHYGIDDDTDISTLPKGKVTVEESKQNDLKLKRLQRERDEAITARDVAVNAHRSEKLRASAAASIAKHDFTDDARDYLLDHVLAKAKYDGDEPLYDAGDGRLVPINDAVAGIAATKKGLLKPQGSGGAGARVAAGSGSRQISTAEFDSLPPAVRSQKMAEGYTLTD